MASGEIGVRFAPLGDEADATRRAGRSGPFSGVQEAVRVLSLRLPRVIGANAPTALPIVGGIGGGGIGDGGVRGGIGQPRNPALEALLRNLLGIGPVSPGVFSAGGGISESYQPRDPVVGYEPPGSQRFRDDPPPVQPPRVPLMPGGGGIGGGFPRGANRYPF